MRKLANLPYVIERFTEIRTLPAVGEKTMLLRGARIEDVPQIMALESLPEYRTLVGSWSEEEHLRCLAYPDARCFIAEQIDRVRRRRPLQDRILAEASSDAPAARLGIDCVETTLQTQDW